MNICNCCKNKQLEFVDGCIEFRCNFDGEWLTNKNIDKKDCKNWIQKEKEIKNNK